MCSKNGVFVRWKGLICPCHRKTIALFACLFKATFSNRSSRCIRAYLGDDKILTAAPTLASFPSASTRSLLHWSSSKLVMFTFNFTRH